ncbi:MAG: hypothetical protein JF595_07630 [Sphingomonadales bacterium]|nr:hypothetical protein [Sphingomonadales bacterium]
MARGWHHHDGIDGGDVVAGLLIFGGIAAIAAAASKSHKDRQARDDDRYRDYPDSDYREVPPQRYDGNRDDGYRDETYRDQTYRDRPSGNWRSGMSADGAVDACVGEVERGDRSIDSVDSADRDADGWRITGHIRGGNDFSCSVDGSGRVRDVTGL